MLCLGQMVQMSRADGVLSRADGCLSRADGCLRSRADGACLRQMVPV